MKKIICLAFLSLIVLTGCGIITENATYYGYPLAVETNGLIFKADVVYLKTDLESSDQEVVCIENNELKEILRIAAKNKQKVEIKYHNEFFYSPNRCHNLSDAFGMIDEIEILKN